MTAGASGKKASSGRPLFAERFLAVHELIGHCRVKGESELLIGGEPVTPQSCLRKSSQLRCNVLGRPARRAIWNYAIDQPYCESLIRVDGPTCHNEIERAADAYNSWQPDSALSYQCPSPDAVEDAENGIFFHHPKVAEQSQLQATGYSVTCYGGYDRF